MAIDTNQALRNKVIYEVYVRNHSEEGNFKGLQKDLTRIKSLGADIIWLAPIHPIGRIHRKDNLGCPYSIQNYREINPEYGTLDDFKELVTRIHGLGLKIMIDIVFNHTSHDSWLLKHHPEWFFHTANGEIGGKVADWSDVIDLDYTHPELWNYQIETLKFWVNQGVDGFRCDVAPLVPIEFWSMARGKLEMLKPGVIWLAESCDPSFISFLRRQNFIAHSDCELYQAFDITYDYDIYDTFEAYLHGEATLEEYLNLKGRQETIYPANYLKLRFLENHDRARIRSLIFCKAILRQWTAFTFFEKGVTLLYAGQETQDLKTPSLFIRDLVDWSSMNPDFCHFLTTLSAIKKEPILSHGFYQLQSLDKSGVIWASYRSQQHVLHGIFNVEGKCGLLKIDCQDGQYQNLINGANIKIEGGSIELQPVPLIFYGKPREQLRSWPEE